MTADRRRGPGPVRTTVVGLGRIARTAYLPRLRDVADVEVVGLWDVEPNVQAEAAREVPGARPALPGEPFEDHLDRTGTELVVNLTPPGSHAALTRRALAAGRHVFCEKPLSLRPDEAEELAALARARGRWLTVAPHVVGCPLLLGIRAVLDGGELGHVHLAHLRYGCSSDLAESGTGWRADAAHGGVLVDLGSYPFAVLDVLFGPPVGVASCQRSAVTTPEGARLESWSVGLDHGSGRHAVVQTGTHYGFSGFSLELRLIGSSGELRLDGGNLMSREFEVASRTRKGWTTVTTPPSTYHWAGGPAELARRIRAGHPPEAPTTAVGLVHTVAACHARAGADERS